MGMFGADALKLLDCLQQMLDAVIDQMAVLEKGMLKLTGVIDKRLFGIGDDVAAESQRLTCVIERHLSRGGGDVAAETNFVGKSTAAGLPSGDEVAMETYFYGISTADLAPPLVTEEDGSDSESLAPTEPCASAAYFESAVFAVDKAFANFVASVPADDVASLAPTEPCEPDQVLTLPGLPVDDICIKVPRKLQVNVSDASTAPSERWFGYEPIGRMS